MTKLVMLAEMEEVLENSNLTKTGAYYDLLKHIFNYFSADEIQGLLNHIKEETGGN